jgi:ATP-dependent DNA helicase RecG
VNESLLTERLIEKGEELRTEFIADPGKLERIAQTVCAMLNSAGGAVFIGVDDDGRVMGDVTEADAGRLRQYLHEHITPSVLYTVSVDETAGGRVISVDVPVGRDRPYVFDGTIYVRTGARQTRVADASTIRSLVEKRAAQEERWERRSAVGLDLDDIDRELLFETARRAQEGRGYRLGDSRDVEVILSALSLTQFGELTNAADVLFGRRVALRHPQTRMRAVHYASDRGDDFIDEQLFEGPAFVLLENAMAFLRRHVSIAAEFKAGQLSRESRPAYPFASLREGLVNALVHRDYASFSGGVSVSIYPDRIEIWNSGHLPEGLSPRRLREPSHESILVNPDISHVFYLHELMERVGRGTFKIVQECRAMGLWLPQWKNESLGVRLTLFAPGRSDVHPLNERQRALLEELTQGEHIRLGEFLDRFGSGISERQARRDLKELEEAGLLERVGAGRSTAYERTNAIP